MTHAGRQLKEKGRVQGDAKGGDTLRQQSVCTNWKPLTDEQPPSLPVKGHR